MKTFSSKKMPDRLRRHFMIYRSKISMFLDTADFDEPLMVDVSDALEMTPDNIDNADAPELFGPSRPGAEAVWVEGVVHGSVFSSRGASRIGAMIHHSTTRTSFRSQAWTGASDEFLIETFVRDSEGFARSAGPDIRFRLGTDGRVVGIEFLDEKTEAGENARKKTVFIF
ncbi:hypothetical protein IV500_04955 [Paeniglutamicibacter antarcticus]|uniref:Uncharacterized protein n=1 Tax=Arthrobacter terrae TaxID=2935737 RepID=A0A931CKR9_9MICC|nr:hypothetical protein [Arthrobacter terrae]MBG0738767.1 hypothetical protein [Arthrobacter terrae]